MKTRVYMLLNISEGKSEQVMQNLLGKPGILVADQLDGSSDIMLIVEASDRQRLAIFIMSILDSIENVTEDVRLLVTRDSTIREAVCLS